VKRYAPLKIAPGVVSDDSALSAGKASRVSEADKIKYINKIIFIIKVAIVSSGGFPFDCHRMIENYV
jgi:hypothetical protein